jgi:cell fate regulator YaaT (PSP1 superfamily)
MPQVVGIKFRNSSKIYYFAPNGIDHPKLDEFVVVETARGQEIGKIAFETREVPDNEIRGKLKGILRRATAVDLTQMEKYQQRESQALHQCREQVTEHSLPMKVIRAEYNFNGTHLTFYFTSDRRVDFRALVKELARIFRTRIELRQVGVRDDVKLLGGYGRCGRPHCCSTWLNEFCPISIRMAKQQDLPLSPMEISGTCGRLLCCLAYENEFYKEIKSKMPRVGRTIDTPHGKAKVKALNALEETITIELPNEVTTTISLQDLESESKPEPQKPSGRRRKSKKKE